MRNQKIYIERNHEKEPSLAFLLVGDLLAFAFLIALMGIVTLACVVLQPEAVVR